MNLDNRKLNCRKSANHGSARNFEQVPRSFQPT